MVLSAIFAFVFICEYLVSLREKALPAEAKRKKKKQQKNVMAVLKTTLINLFD